MYSKEVKLKNMKEKLSTTVSRSTCQDIEDFLFPNFDMNTQVPQGRRTRRIVKDGHGRWREINVNDRDEKKGKNYNITTTETTLPRQRSSSTRGNKLSFSNHILNSVKSSPKPQTGKLQDINYKTLSTNTRANIFPGVGKHNWYSQSNNVYSESALKLGDHCDLQDQFYGITRDDLGAWNEASVHHERMKKSWEAYLVSLAKAGGVAKSTKGPNESAVFKVQEIVKQTRKTRKVKKSVRKQTQEETGEEGEHNEHKAKDINDKQISPQFQQTVQRDDDFWDFYEQPFVQS